MVPLLCSYTFLSARAELRTGRAAPGRSAPGRAAPGRSVPGCAVPGRAAPGRSAPELGRIWGSAPVLSLVQLIMKNCLVVVLKAKMIENRNFAFWPTPKTQLKLHLKPLWATLEANLSKAAKFVQSGFKCNLSWVLGVGRAAKLRFSIILAFKTTTGQFFMISCTSDNAGAESQARPSSDAA